MRIYNRKIESLPVPIYNKLFALNLGETGEMQYTLRSIKLERESYGKGEYRAIWICDPKNPIMPDGTPNIVSWVLLHRGFKGARAGVYVYTDTKHRGKGYASILLHYTISKHGNINVYPYNEKTFKYFSSLGYTKLQMKFI